MGKAAELSPAGTDVRTEIRALLRDSSHYLLGLIGSLGLGFVSFPLFTRVFSVADYGLIDLAQKALLMVVAVAKFGLPNSALRFYNARELATDPGAAPRYYSTMFFGAAVPALALTLVFAGALAVVPVTWVSAGLASVLMVSSLLIVPRALQAIFWSFLRVEERTGAYNALTLVLRAGTIAAVCLLLTRWHASAQLYFAGTIFIEAAVVAGLVVSLATRGQLRFGSFDYSLFKAACVFGTPLILNEIAFVVLDAGDRALVQQYLGGEALGIYAVAYGLANMVQSLLMTPLNLAVLPLYLRLWNSGGREKTVEFLSAGLDLLLLASTGLLVIVSVTARDAVTVMASPKYQSSAPLLPMLMAGLLIFTTSIFISAGLLIYKQTKRVAAVMAASAVVNLALNCLLLPRMGLQGAALATLLSYVFFISALAYVSFKSLPLRLDWRAMLRYAAAGAAAWAVAATVNPGPALWSAAVKSAIAVTVYVAGLYWMDARVRLWTRRLLADPLSVFSGQR